MKLSTLPSIYFFVYFIGTMFILKEDLRPKTQPCFHGIILMILWKKPCATFCGVLISSHEVTKLQNFESSVSDVIPANVKNIPSLVFWAYYC